LNLKLKEINLDSTLTAMASWEISTLTKSGHIIIMDQGIKAFHSNSQTSAIAIGRTISGH
jgi:hypothetical protein